MNEIIEDVKIFYFYDVVVAVPMETLAVSNEFLSNSSLANLNYSIIFYILYYIYIVIFMVLGINTTKKKKIK